MANRAVTRDAMARKTDSDREDGKTKVLKITDLILRNKFWRVDVRGPSFCVKKLRVNKIKQLRKPCTCS